MNCTGWTRSPRRIAGTVQSPVYDYGYDDLSRLESAAYPGNLGLPSPPESFGYDAASNRDDDVGSPTLWAYDANNQLVTSPFAALHCYDADGNLTTQRGSGQHLHERYADRDLHVGCDESLDALPQRDRGCHVRIRSVREADPEGRRCNDDLLRVGRRRLLVEYGVSGISPVRYAYAGGFAPVQVAYASGTHETIYDVHSDHLDTPKMLTDDTGEQFGGAHQAFGSAHVDEDPDGDTTEVTFNIRFPGQYYDAESDLHDNRLSSYDPSIGRYISADPIGQRGLVDFALYDAAPMTSPQEILVPNLGTDEFGYAADALSGAGVNLYPYVDSNPLNWIDSIGDEKMKIQRQKGKGGQQGQDGQGGHRTTKKGKGRTTPT